MTSLNVSAVSTQSGGSTCSSRSSSPNSVSSLPGAVDEEISLPPIQTKMSELQDLANHIASRAKSKFSGRVFEDVRNAFLAVDENGDGKLTASEAQAFCEHFSLSAEKTERFFKLLDRHDTGLADWKSFLSVHAPVFKRKTDCKRNASLGRKWPALQ